MKITFTILVLILLLGWTTVMGATPTITSFIPASGAIGSSVTITGTNFNTTAAQNIVFFGATQAVVTAASATSLTLTVPIGATYQYISVTDLAVGLTAYSAKPFIVTLAGSITFTGKVDFTTGTNPYSVSIGDIDGDGKPDLVVANYGSASVSVLRNTSTSGTVSFAAKADFATGTNPISVSIGDLNGDGKPDLAVANSSSASVSVFRNTSTSGSVSFAAKVDLTTGTSPYSVSIGDIDGDGKPDLAVANSSSASVSVFRNTSTSGSITGSSFAAKVDFITGTNPQSVSIGDIDGDGKPDLAVANSSSASVSVLRNTSTSGSITSGSFAAKVDFATGSGPRSVSIGDINGDGKPDLAVANSTGPSVSVFRNTSTSGTITSGSFATKVDFTTGTNPYSVRIGDIDGDGKPDLAVANYGATSVSVIRQISPPPTITSFTPASACTGTTVTITGTNFTGATIVSFGGTAATSFSVVSTTSITAVVGGGTSGSVGVTTPGGTATLAGFISTLPGGTFSLSGGVLTISINVTTTVTVQTTGSGNYTFTLGSGGWTGSETGISISGTTLTVASAATQNTINIVDGAAGVNVTFANSTTNTYDDNFNVTLDGGAGAVTFNNTSFSGGNALGITTDKNIVVNGGSSLTTANGNLTLSANMQTMQNANNFIGIAIGTASQTANTYVKSTGTGIVSITGRGGASATSTNNGVYVNGATSYPTTITSGGGSVTVTGTGGGTGSSTNNSGVYVSYSTILSGGNGNVNVSGTGGSSSTANAGLYLQSSSTISSGGIGTVTVTGTGTGGSGSGSSSAYGVAINGVSHITSGGLGAVQVTGQGSTACTGPSNYGVLIYGTSIADTSSVTSGGGNIIVNGTGGGTGGSSNSNYGVSVGYSSSQGVIKSSGSGSITVTGTGGSAGGSYNYGVYITNALSNITAYGTGSVSITGSGGGTGATDTNYGIYLYGPVVGNGATINGYGGTQCSGANNYGTYIYNSKVYATGTGNVVINGTGGGKDGSGYNSGIYLYGANSIISSLSGNVSVTGTGGGTSGSGTSNRNYGISDYTSATITAGGTGTVSIIGTGGGNGSSATYNTGIFTSPGTITSGGGAVTLEGHEGAGTGASNSAFNFSGGAVTTVTNGGLLTLKGNSFNVGASIQVPASTGILNVIPATADVNINLGSGTDVPGGPIAISYSEFKTYMSGGNLTFGDANTGSITISAAMTAATGSSVKLTTSPAGGVIPLYTGTDLTITGQILSFGSGTPLKIDISGSIVNTNYQQLTVAGTVNLTGSTLSLSGSYTPEDGKVFTIVSATNLTGTFTGLADGSQVTFNGRSLTINYTSTAVTLTTPYLPSISTIGGFSTFTYCSGSVSAAQSFIASGAHLTDNITITAPTGFEVSTSESTGYASSITLTQSGGNVSNTTVYVRLTSPASGSPSGNVSLTSSSATTQNLAVSGTVNATEAPTSVSADPSIIAVGSSSNLNATSAGNTINWFTATTGGPSLGSSASGSNYSVTPATNTTYYAETQLPSASASLTLATNSAYAASGVFFDVAPAATAATINGFHFRSNSGGTKQISVYCRTGTYVGHTTTSGDWTLYGTFTSNADVYGFVPIPNLTIPSGTTFGFYLYCGSALKVQSGSGTYADSKISVVCGSSSNSLFSAVNSGTTFYGDVTYVTTQSQTSCTRTPVTVTVNQTPATQASGISFSSETNTQMDISWSIGSGTSRAVFVKQASSGTASPINNATYTANTTFGNSGSQIGSSGWYCVYNETGTTVTVTGLTQNTSYQVHVCEYNGAAGGEAYNTASATNNPVSQWMLSIPTIASFTPSSAATGATVTITGTNLTGATAVGFGGTATTSFVVVDANTIKAVVASGTTGILSVITTGGTAILSGFVYYTTAGDPINLVATAGDASASIEFAIPASDGGSAITNYEYSTNGSTWMPLSPADISSPVTISGLTNGTTYTVYLRAVNGAGSGTSSTSVSVTPVAPCANPTGGGTIASDQSGEAPFNPDAFTSTIAATGHTGTLEYKWQSSTTSSSAGFSDISSSNSDTYDSGALSVTTWFKRLARVSCATDWTGAVESNVLKATALNLVAEPSAQPTKLNFSNTVTSGNTNIVINYTASASATSYLVVRKTGSAPTFVPQDGTAYTTGAQGSDQIVYAGTATSAADLTITKGSIYYYAIYAYNGSGESCNYLTSNPLIGSSLCVNNNTGSLPNSSGLSSSAGFPDVGANVTFPSGTSGTTIIATKTSNSPTSNLSVLPGVRGVSNLYFTITSSQPSPGTFILVLDFSGLGLTQDKWASFKIMKRTNSSAAWSDITSLGGTITNRCTDGVWGKFTISGLSSFSDFALGEIATVHVVTSAAESAATTGTLKYCIENAVAGDFISFNLESMGTNKIKLTTPVVIGKDMTIQGAASGIILDGNNVTKVLEIYSPSASDPQPVVRLEKLTITKGNDTGNVVGGIDNSGTLTMVNCLVVDNSDTGYLDGAGAVGGISSSGNLTFINCTIAGNAGAPSGDAGLEGIGGIYCNGDLKIYNTIIYGNTGYYHSMASTRNIIESYDCLFEETYDFLTDPKENNNFFFQGNPESDNKFLGNPKFVGKANNAVNPYLILGVSLCVDGGNDTYSFDDTDIRGGSFERKLSKDDLLVKSPIDIGAYEWKKGTDPNNIFVWTGNTDCKWALAGNWDINEVPKPEDLVTVPDVPKKPEVASLSVTTGGQLTIHANSWVTTTGAVDNNGTIIIRSDIDGTGSLITSESAKGSGQALIERYMVKNQWHIISSPTGTQTIQNFLSDNVDIPIISGKTPVEYGMMDYNPTTNDWNPYFTDATAGTLGIGKGYMVRVQDPVQVLRFQGIINATANVTVTLGWNCIGNPFTSAININATAGTDNFMTYNASAFDASYGGLYFWNQGLNKYDVINNTGIAYKASVGQGFFMKVKDGAPSVLFTPDMQVHQIDAPFKTTSVVNPAIKLKAQSGDKSFTTDILFIDGTTKGLDFGYDAGLFATDKSFTLYTKLVDDNGVNFQLQCLPTNQYDKLVIPVGIDLKAGGEIVFTAETVQLDPTCKAILEDKLTNTFTDLSTGSYKVVLAANITGTGRFYLHTGDIVSGIEDQVLAGRVTAYARGNKEIRVIGEVANEAVATLFNGLGQVVLTKKLGAGSLNIIGIPNLSSGLYLLNINDNGTPQTIKIMIRK